MGTEIKNAVNATDTDAQYDKQAKRLLGNKIILAHILAKTVNEFHGMNPKDIVPYIEGEPYISEVPVEPGLTNAAGKKDGQRIVGMNTENAEINEGYIFFDIIFYVRMKDGISKIIINVEVQKDKPSEYQILNRAIFYVSRLVSSQKERNFTGTNYDDINRVFSIWVCVNMMQDSMNFIHLTNDTLLGSYEWEGKIDLLNIVLIGLSKKLPEHDAQHELHRLLGTLLSKQLSTDEKLNIMKTEYRIPIEDKIRKEVNELCNLSQDIREDGIAIGEARFILSMHKKGYALEEIAEVAEKSVEEVKAIIARREPVLA